MKKRYLRAVLLFLGIAGIIAYSFFPDKKKIECLEKELAFYPYGEAEDGIQQIEVKPFEFKCSLSNENGNCGIGLSFGETKNWNLMDSLFFELQNFEDFEELIAQILTIDPDHTISNDRNSMKPLIKEIKLEQNKKHYSIALEHFYTPDYWFEQQKAKNTRNAKRFSAVAGLEVFSGWKNQIDKPLELKIEAICVEGASNAPFVTLVIYIGILIATAISVRIKT